MEKIRKYFFSLFTVTIFAFGTMLAIVFNVDPETADFLTIGALFASLFLTISGFLTIVIFYLRVRLSNWEIIFAQLPIAMRHAILVSLVITGLLFLQMLRALNWWEGGLYVLILVLLESYFRTRPQLS